MPECVPDQTTYTHDQLLAIYSTKGVLSDVLADAGPDKTGHFPVAALQQRMNDMINAGTLPAVLPPGSISQGDIEAQIEKDKALFKSLESEFCFYQSRYQYALNQFVTLATSRVQTDNAAARQALSDSVTLNQRVNFILEMTNYLAQQRAPVASAESATINSANAEINAKLQALQSTYNLLKRDNAIVAVQREMVNYTNTKNQSAAGTVTMWIIGNVLALGAIGGIYAFL
jgi:hypothetical protein